MSHDLHVSRTYWDPDGVDMFSPPPASEFSFSEDLFSEKEVVRHLIAAIAECGSQKNLAVTLGVSQQHLSDVTRKKKPVTKRIAELLNFQRVIAYRAIEKWPAEL